ncbi:unnamed protein product [Larinioides sclopetarius]|uniref:Uncharacterized protein n=1 Tax=Larinioides sclopetarius TaxID=280406 RepID=A0AAV1YWE4_9ARAC
MDDKIWAYLYSSHDQQLCDQLLDCNNQLADPYLKAYNECIKVMLPNGIGSCDENSELYYSEGIRRQINRCMQCKVVGKEFTDDDKQQMGVFQCLLFLLPRQKKKEHLQCLHALGEKAGCYS